MPDAPRTGDEWLRTRPVEEQREEYRRRAAADAAEARALGTGRSPLMQCCDDPRRWAMPMSGAVTISSCGWANRRPDVNDLVASIV